MPLSFEEVIDRMTKTMAKFNSDKIKMKDLAKTGGVVEEGGETNLIFILVHGIPGLGLI